MSGWIKRLCCALLYVAAVVAANRLTEQFGLVPIGFGLLVTAGTFAAALALLARNIGQDVLGRAAIAGLMLIGCGLSWWLASPQLAIASAAAFALSETADMLAYTALRTRLGRPRALATAGMLGAIIDTFAFLHLAGFPLQATAVAGQLLVKAGLSIAVAAGLGVRRALLRQPLHAEGA